MTGDPLGREIFGPRQGALIDALTERLRNGFAPMNEYDVQVASWLASILGLDGTGTPALGRGRNDG